MQHANTNRKRFFLLSLLALCFYQAQATSLDTLISKFQRDFSLRIVVDEKIAGTWSVTYELCNDSAETHNYLELLYQEYQKYPPGFFEKIQIGQIVVCKDLAFQNQYRAAVPDPLKNLLFLSVNGQKGVFTTYYLIYVMHHELHHCTEQALWNTMYYRWNKWDKLNAKNFQYGQGGVIAYEKTNSSINWIGAIHPQEGFINLYSTTGQEEDRSELMALLMTDKGNADILKYYSDDRIIQHKLDLLVSALNKLNASDQNYWTLRLAEIKTVKN